MNITRLTQRLASMLGEVAPTDHWREQLITSSQLKGLQSSSEDSASRSWLPNPPTGWRGREFVRAVQLRNNNLPTAALPSNPTKARICRAGCLQEENIYHVLQQSGHAFTKNNPPQRDSTKNSEALPDLKLASGERTTRPPR